MWNEFLPISMPITAGAGEVSSFCDMACSLSSVPPASILPAGPEHGRTIPLAVIRGHIVGLFGVRLACAPGASSAAIVDLSGWLGSLGLEQAYRYGTSARAFQFSRPLAIISAGWARIFSTPAAPAK